jgi:hypothetical protein
LNTHTINLNNSTVTVITKDRGISEEGKSGEEEIYFSVIVNNVSTIFLTKLKMFAPECRTKVYIFIS